MAAKKASSTKKPAAKTVQSYPASTPAELKAAGTAKDMDIRLGKAIMKLPAKDQDRIRKAATKTGWNGFDKLPADIQKLVKSTEGK